MEKEQFKRALSAGLGRCYFELRLGDKEKYRDLVQWACIHNLTYDTQVDGTPHEYVYRLVKCYDDPTSFLPEVLKRFRRFDYQMDDWGMLYYVRLLTLFAIDGSQDAALAIRDKYEELFTLLKKPDRVVEGYFDLDEEVYTMLGEALLDIDGCDAYVKIAQDLNALNVCAGIVGADLPWLIEHIKELPPSPDFYVYVVENAKEDVSAFIADYLGEETDRPRKEYEDDEDETNGKKEEAEVADEDIRYYHIWGIRKSNPVWKRYPGLYERAKIARDYFSEIEEELAPYEKNPYGISMKALEPYLHHYEKKIRSTAIGIFSEREDPESVEYTFRRLLANGPEWWTMEHALRNYTPENEQFLVYLLEQMEYDFEDNGRWHTVVSTIVDDCQSDAPRLPRSILTVAYQRSLCKNCRFSLLRTLYANGWLSNELQAECYYDANEDIAIYAQKNNFYRMDL